MNPQSVRSKTVTSATPLTALGTAGAPVDSARAAVSRLSDLSREFSPEQLSVSIYNDLGAVESEWRNFQKTAACTPFQTFEWLSAWQYHIGTREGFLPVIVVGRFA